MTTPYAAGSTRTGAAIDAPLDGNPLTVDPARRSWRSARRLALGLEATPRAGWVLLVFAMALGPHGLRVISDSALASLDPAVTTALAALGVIVGLDVRLRRSRDGRLLVAASAEAGVVLATVTMGMLVMYPRSEAPSWLSALLLGICAAPSSTAGASAEHPGTAPAARVGDLDDVLPIVAGGIALAAMRHNTAAAVPALLAQSVAIAIVIAAAAGLLITRTSSESEQRVFALGALLLLGGAAAYLSVSALFAGLVAGLCWNGFGFGARDQLVRDIRHLQHPLIVLLLIAAGARLELSIELAGPIAAYVALRTAGKLAGGWLGRSLAAAALPRDLGLSFLGPGLVGIAFALDAHAGGAPGSATLLAVVLMGSLASELASQAIRWRGAQA